MRARRIFVVGVVLWAAAVVGAWGEDTFTRDVQVLAAGANRLSGLPGNAGAVDYVAQRLREAGVDEVVVQEFPSVQVVNKRCEIEFGGKRLALRQIRPNGIVPPVTPEGGIVGELVYAGGGTMSEFGSEAPTGKIVVLDYNTGRTWLESFRLGARAVIFVGGEPLAGEAHFLEANINLPRFYYEGDRGDLVEGEEAVIYSEAVWEPVVSRNVVGLIRGSAPMFAGREEAIVVSAALDTFGQVPELTPGARGAANVAGLLELAEALVEERPRRHTVVAFLNNEARGFEGARKFYRATDAGIREAAATLAVRQSSLEDEEKFLAEISRALAGPNPMAVGGEYQTQLFNRMRLATDEEIENSRAAMGDLRQEIDSLRRKLARMNEGEERASVEEQIDVLGAELAALEEPHATWNTFRRALARGRLGEAALDARYRQVIETVEREVGSRLAELSMERRALEADQALHKLLGGVRISLHLSVNFGDAGERWGLVFGRASRLSNPYDRDGFYGRVFRVFKMGAERVSVPGFESSAVNPGRQLAGIDFLPHSGEIAGRHGIFNVAVVTALDAFKREGTPIDTVANLDAGRVRAQMQEFTKLLREVAGMGEIPSGSPIIRSARQVEPRFRDSRASGSMVMRRTRGSSVANRAASGAIVQVFPTRPPFLNAAVHNDILYNPRKPVAFDDFIVVRADGNGALSYGPVMTITNTEAGVGILFDERGRAVAVNPWADIPRLGSRLNLFQANHGAVVVPPHMFRGLGQVLNGRTNSPLDLSRSLSVSHDGVVMWYVEEKVPSVKVFGTRSAVAMNVGGRDFFDLAGAGYGAGLPSGPLWHTPRISTLGAADLLALNDTRLEQLRARGVSNLSVEELHARADDLFEKGEESKEVSGGEAFALSAFLASVPVYENVRKNLDDLVKSVLVLLALAVPFAFALERLLIGSASVYRQIAGFVGFFVATFLLLYFTHPAFAVSNAPMIIFLGFTILVLSGLVIFIIMQKFEVELKNLQGMATTVHTADVSRLGTMLAAMAMGISTMRRRPLRTALTAVTIILLTFTILCFASFGGVLGVTTRFIAPLPGYAGVFVHRVNWSALDPALKAVLDGRWGGDGEVTARYWISPEPGLDAGLSIGRADSSRPQDLQGLLGLEEREVGMRGDLAEAFRASEAGFEASVWMTPALADSLEVEPGGTVILNGRTLMVAPLVEATVLGSLRDMDGSSILPVDFQTMESVMGATKDEAAAEVDVSGQSWETIPPDNLVVVAAPVAVSLYARPRAFTIYTEDAAGATAIAEDAARMLRAPVAATREDSVYWHIFGTVLSASGARDLLLPIVLGGLVVFGTMLGSVADREKEIYTFSALGLAPPHVASLFFAEAMVFSVIGGLGGYLTAQMVIEGLKLLAAAGLATVPEINYSSTNAIVTILIVMGTVLVSAIYPAVKASRSANPGVMRSWKMPDPQGDLCVITFPFTVSSYDLTGVVSFLKEHFANFQDTGLGAFLSRDVRLLRDAQGNPGVACHLALAPFDLGVTQDFELWGVPSEIAGIDEVRITLRRRSGQPKDWQRLNKVLLDDLRKQFLIWRSIPSEVMEIYRLRTLTESEKEEEVVES